MTNTWEQFALVLAQRVRRSRCRTADSEHRKAPGFLSNQLGMVTLSASGNAMDDTADAEAVFGNCEERGN